MSRRSKQRLSEDPITTQIESISHDGRGITHIEGKTLFIQNALPDETVKFKYRRVHRRFDEGEAVEIIHANPARVTPKCPHYAMCGGCSLQHANSDYQIALKQKTLLEQLEHFGHVHPQEILPPITAFPWNYRRKARLGVRSVPKKSDTVLIGFRERNGRYLTEMTQCPILHKSIDANLNLLREFISTLEAYATIPQIEVAIGDNQSILIIRHMEPLSDSDLKKLRQFGDEHQLIFYLQPKGPDTAHPLDPALTELPCYKLTDQNITISFHPTDFIQVNREINQQMVNRALELLDPKPTDHILDLFCGLGNFSLPIAQQCQQVVGVEGDENLVMRAGKNATQNRLDHVKFYTANLADDISQTSWAKQSYNKILLDPPRTGAQEMLPFIHDRQPERIVYVSCNPATLARDAGKLSQLGWSLQKVGILDMFPHTTHFESIALFLPTP